MKSQYLCLPLLKNNPNAASSATSAARRQPNGSLFDRIRVAVFRLIMLTTLSKGGGRPSSATAPAAINHRNHGGVRSSPATVSGRPSYCSYYRAPYDDPHQSEALADCIEFLRKSSVITTSFEDESDGASPSDQVIMPVIVM